MKSFIIRHHVIHLLLCGDVPPGSPAFIRGERPCDTEGVLRRDDAEMGTSEAVQLIRSAQKVANIHQYRSWWLHAIDSNLSYKSAKTVMSNLMAFDSLSYLIILLTERPTNIKVSAWSLN